MSYAAPVPYLQCPATILNQAVDCLGESGKIIGDLTDGTPVAETARRNYGQVLRQLLRTSHWPFARKQAKLTLLGDATGNSAPPISSFVDCPWAYAYAWPIDGVQGRWLPWNPTNAQPLDNNGVPITTGTSALVQYPLIPGRFLVSSSDQYPMVVGQIPWDQMPDLQRTEGVGPTSRQIILTDCANAQFVYTRMVPVIEEWDSLFRASMVLAMALTILPVAIEDRKIQIAERDRLVPTLKNAIADARVASGNEAGYPQSTDFEASWMVARNTSGVGLGGIGGFGGFGGAYQGAGGYLYLGWAPCAFGGSVF